MKAKENDELVIKRKASGEYSVRAKVYLYNENGEIRKGKPLSLLNGPFNQSGTKETAELLGPGIFDFPKPVELIKYFFGFCVNESEDNDGIYLDFFAGSCVSAQAVFELNKENSGKHKFIMVQLPELCSSESKAFKSGYKTIADIGKERIRRFFSKFSEEQSAQLSLGDFGELDLGFKVLKLDRSNFRIWDGDVAASDDLAEQLEMHVDHVSEASGPEDILYELLLKAGFPLTTKVEAVELAGKPVFSIEDGALLICLEKEITSELIDAMAEANPLQVICLDEGFKGNDQLKANAVQTFKARAQSEESEIVFRTVYLAFPK